MTLSLNMAVLILLGLVVVSESVDRLLPFVIVTPYMHRTHQSVVLAEGNSNFSQIFPWWDWVFGTYKAVPSKRAADLKMRLAEQSIFSCFNLVDLLLQPFRTTTPLNKHNNNRRRRYVQ
jgi:sterol desaturase/sphingolipid hydroxylase (fatty acid hydroxylase superfamily)